MCVQSSAMMINTFGGASAAAAINGAIAVSRQKSGVLIACEELSMGMIRAGQNGCSLPGSVRIATGSADLQFARAVTEFFQIRTDPFGHREEPVVERRFVREVSDATRLHRAGTASGKYDRQVVVLVLIPV